MSETGLAARRETAEILPVFRGFATTRMSLYRSQAALSEDFNTLLAQPGAVATRGNARGFSTTCCRVQPSSVRMWPNG